MVGIKPLTPEESEGMFLKKGSCVAAGIDAGTQGKNLTHREGENFPLFFLISFT
ncbi:hypothetical protein IQ275_26640 [Nostoc sp. LEGE 12450]|nr:hypothetical protein [Nostoc sp. LEGE 12450]